MLTINLSGHKPLDWEELIFSRLDILTRPGMKTWLDSEWQEGEAGLNKKRERESVCVHVCVCVKESALKVLQNILP